MRRWFTSKRLKFDVGINFKDLTFKALETHVQPEIVI